MIFRAIQVKNFGVLKGPLSVTFGPGLNVIHGPNESGKSTLVGALWAALTLRHRVGGDVRQARAYVPRTGGVPEVSVDFEMDGVRYAVDKRFAAQRGTARLKSWYPDGRVEDLTDADAEARLAALLGTARGADGKRDEELGLLPLLWVRQERASMLPSADLHEGGRQTLADVLSRLSGELLGGPEAEALYDGARAQRDRYYTATGLVRRSADGPFLAVTDGLAKATERLRALETRQADHEALLEQVERLGAELEEVVARLPELQRAREEAEQAGARLASLRGQVAERKRTVELATRRAAEARRRWDERADVRGRLMQEKTALDALEKAAQTARDASGKVAVTREAREQALRAAEVEEARQRRLWDRADAHLEVLRQRAEVDRRAAELRRAQEILGELSAVRQKLNMFKIDPAQVQRLDNLDRQASTAEATLEAASARVQVRALAEVGLMVGDRPMSLGADEGWSSRLDRPLTLRISELVEVEITPGGKDLDSLRRRAEESRLALRLAMDSLGVASIAEARASAEERRNLTQQADGLARQAESIGSGGPEALSRALEQARASLSNREKVRAGATREGDPPLPADLSAANAARADATTARESARQAAQLARDQLSAHERDSVARSAELARAEERRKESQERIAQLAAQIMRGTAESGDDESLKRQATELAVDMARESDALNSLLAALQSERPDEVEATLLSARRAADGARERQVALERERAHVLGALGAADLVGLHDRLAAARAEVEALQEQLGRLQEQAETARLLYETLDHSRSNARERYLGPLQEETERLLRLLFPDATLVMDDRFNLTQIHRQEADTFDVLSVGTREQIGVVVRLAMASVLSRHAPVPVILDDALVATDETRFQRMIPVFADAAKRHQILLLTCHYSRYQAIQQVADRVINLDALKRATGTPA